MPRSPKGRATARWLDARLRLRHAFMAQQPIAIAGSKGLPVFRTSKHSTNSLRIAATTICLGLRRLSEDKLLSFLAEIQSDIRQIKSV